MPSELRGREVAVRAVLPVWEAARRKGASPEDLIFGTSTPVAHWQKVSERVSWEDFARFLANVGSIMTDDELEAVGGDVLRSPLFRAFVLPARLLFPLAEVYRWGHSPSGPGTLTFLSQKVRFRQVSRDLIHIDASMKRGYTNAREHWLISKGVLRGVGGLFGGAPPEVRMLERAEGDGVRFEIMLPPRRKRFVLLDAMRRGATWVSAARETDQSLRHANQELTERYVELEREAEARRKAEAELRLLNEALERRVIERTAELEAANEELAAANRELSMFSTSAAHDLRSPLRAINGFATAFLEDHGAALAAPAKVQLQQMIDDAVRMGTLIDELLALSRVTRIELRPERVDLAEVAHAVLDRLHALEPTRIVERNIPPSLIVVGDAGLLRSLLENLLGNAWKFTRGQPRARIELERVDVNPSTYRVRDNGVGFDMARADALFEPFRRLHDEPEFSGAGIGLATALRIVRRHGGRIWADATVGEGASFSFTLGS